jgi:MoxR-like ATPase
MLNCDLTYDGSYNPEPYELDACKKPLFPYIPDDDLKESVRLAIALNRPLLVMGDPGCGKTRLANAIAYELTQRNQQVLQHYGLAEWPMYAWYVKSTSRAKDGLYTYDAVARLRDAQLANSGYLDDVGKERLMDIKQQSYINYGPLGLAFQSPLKAVVLIDEIDKAEIDFPNDLLRELDEQRFTIDETQTEIPSEPTPSPIVIITSNNERPLPDAFLRRCIFHYVEAPSRPILENILRKRFQDRLPDVPIDNLLTSYLQARELSRSAGGKRVGTSEFLDWVDALLLEPDQIAEKLQGDLPFKGLLFKTPEEHIRYQRQRRDST